ncbi:orotidine-5'-phosphate decarboxylase [Lacicoccus alkaliphilus]|uniref:Orotidine 5'-phosphate decarboxylase n=2 Tax=Lacicoccus TaxID=3076172 RepID=A0A1M7CE29_9BACL|nr:orotidine-5'-phosphate decarboxylase [Salinicoccus alkaliphilus DSM 16010]
MNTPIIALDFREYETVKEFLGQFDEKLFVKVGLELYLSNGPKIVEEIRQMGHDIFLDLKLYDIPNTVGKAMEGIGRLDIQMTNVHAQGGTAMMKRAVESFKDGNPDGKLIAVTQLTSMSDEMVAREQQSVLTLTESVVHYSALAQNAGLDGVVASPLEAEIIHEKTHSDFLTVTPGIRLEEDSNDDQVRVVTPEDAKKMKSDYIVVGRSITQAENPVDKYNKIKSIWEGSTVG